MKQLIQDLATGVTSVLETPVPTPGPGQVLVRVRASAVSPGTERMIVDFTRKGWLARARARPDLVRRVLDKAARDGIGAALDGVRGRLREPMPLGYSCAGTVEALGSGLEGPAPGTKVACAGAGWANHAEFVSVPSLLCVPIADALPFEEAAFATLAAIALQGLRLGEPRLGERVAVIGLGVVGQLSVQLARASGCRVAAVDLDAGRTRLAGELGAELASGRQGAEERVAAWSDGRGADLVLICADASSNDPIELATALARDRGVVVAVGAIGLGVSRDAFYKKELTLRVSRSYGPGRYDVEYEEGGLDYPFAHVRWTEGRNLEEAARLLGSGALRAAPMITHRFPIDRGAEAYALLSGGTGEPSLGIVLTYPADAPAAKRVDAAPRGAAPRARTADASAPGIGVLGAGAYAASTFLPVIAAGGARLRGIASASGLRAQSAARRFGFSFACSAEADVLADRETDAVAVLTRHHLHARQARAALEAGKHVFVEKPLCLSAAELEDLERALQKAPKAVLCAGFNRRYAPFTAELLEFLSTAPGPRAIQIRVNAGPLPPGHWTLDPEIGGGRLVGEGCHFVDWACAVAGSRPVEADCRRAGTSPGDGDWSLRLLFENGSAADILYVASGAPGAGKERYEVHAGGRSAVLEDFRTLALHSAGARRARRAWLRADKGHAALWAAFLGAIKGERASPIPWPELKATTLAVFAARDSLSRGRPCAIDGPA